MQTSENLMVSFLTSPISKTNRPAALLFLGSFFFHSRSFFRRAGSSLACNAFRPLTSASRYSNALSKRGTIITLPIGPFGTPIGGFSSWTSAAGTADFFDDQPTTESANKLEMEYDARVLRKGRFGTLVEIPLEKPPQKTNPLRHGEESAVYQRVLHSIQMGPRDAPILSLHRFKVWWMRPFFQHPVPPETLFVLEKVEGNNFRLLLPVVLPRQDGHNFASSTLRGKMKEGQDQEQLLLCGNKEEAGLYVGVAADPYALVQDGVTLATRLWNSSYPMSPTTTRVAPTNNVALEKLGWCTWNAFYTDLDGPRVVDAIRTLQGKHGIPIRWMILDDGWQHITDRPPPKATDFSSSAVTDTDLALDGAQWSQRLQSFREDPKKFHAQDLKTTIQQLHDELGMKAVWVWHTLAGYWMGVNTEGEAFSGYASSSSNLRYPHFPPGILDNDASASLEASVKEGIGITADAVDFFKQYHTDYLSEIGVDGIKVDAQGVIGVLQEKKWEENHENSYLGAEAPVLRLHNALAESVKNNFATSHPKKNSSIRQSPSIIHCMAHAPEIFYRLPGLYQTENDVKLQQLPLCRAADDFYPDNPHSHGPQIVACTYNSILLNLLSITDWDMFTTSAKVDPRILKSHAVARCLSGGPIYFSSGPKDLMKYMERPVWIDWICCSDGTTLPCRGTALPLASCLLHDPLKPNAKPMVLWNTNGGVNQTEEVPITSGVFGVFHLAGSGTWDYSKLNYVSNTKEDTPAETLKTVVLSPSDIPLFKDRAETSFLAVNFFSQAAQELAFSKSSLSVELGHSETEVVSIHPLEHHVVKGDCILDVVPLGLEGKINGAGAVLDIRTSASSMDLKIRGCGSLLVAVKGRDNGVTNPISDVGVLVQVNGNPLRTRHTFASSDRPQAAFDAGLPSSDRLRRNLIDIGYDIVVVNIPDTARAGEEPSEKAQVEHVILDFSA